MSGKRVIIVGAGITGLAAADAVQSAGGEAIVIEASNRVGGRMIRISRGGDIADVGAQFIYSNYPEVRKLVERMGLNVQLRPAGRVSAYRAADGSLHTVRTDRDMLGLLGLRGTLEYMAFKAKYFTFAQALPFGEISVDVPRYDNVSVEDALSWTGRAFKDYVLRPLAHGMAGCTPDQLSLYYVVQNLRVQWTGTPDCLESGNVTLCERLAATLDVRFGHKVAALAIKGETTVGVVLEDGTVMDADHVILTCEIGATAKIVPETFAPARQFLENFNHSPIPMPIFFLDRPLEEDATNYMGHPHHDATFNMAINHTRKCPYMVPSGKAIISAWPALKPHQLDWADKSEDELIALALKDVEVLIPGISGWVEEARLTRHAWGYARYRPGDFKQVLDFKAYAAGLAGLSFAGNDYDGVLLESGVKSAQRAARRAMA